MKHYTVNQLIFIGHFFVQNVIELLVQICIKNICHTWMGLIKGILCLTYLILYVWNFIYVFGVGGIVFQQFVAGKIVFQGRDVRLVPHCDMIS